MKRSVFITSAVKSTQHWTRLRSHGPKGVFNAGMDTGPVLVMQNTT